VRIPVSRPDLGPLELANVQKAVESTWISSSGEFLRQLEERFQVATGCDFAIPVANGTVALHLVLAALGIGPGDEVIVPSLTYIATANSVRYTGATPVFADVTEADWGLDAAQVEALVTPRTRAVIAVHLYGHPADMAALRAVTDRHSLTLIEDAAEAPFATVDGRPVGSLGDVATFSFYGNKIISSGEGGAVTTSDPALAARMRLLRGQGMDPERRYFFPVVGFNYRMTNVAAAIACAQLDRADEMLAARRRLYAAYDEAIAAVPGLSSQPVQPWATISPWLYPVVVESGEDERDRLMRELDAEGVETRPFFIPIHRLPPYLDEQGNLVADLPVTDRLATCGFSLPTSSSFTADETQRVVDALRTVAGE
jgi:perosamine synthetase